MKCPKCNGRGTHIRRETCGCRDATDWYCNGCNDQVPCKQCGGLGYSGMEQVRALLVEIRASSKGTVQRLAERALKEF